MSAVERRVNDVVFTIGVSHETVGRAPENFRRRRIDADGAAGIGSAVSFPPDDCIYPSVRDRCNGTAQVDIPVPARYYAIYGPVKLPCRQYQMLPTEH